MEWLTFRHLGLRSQVKCGAFHPFLPLFALAVDDRRIVEFDVLTGCKLASVDMGVPVVQMGYSPAGGHVIVAVLEDLTVRSWDLEAEHTYVLHSPENRKSEKQTEVHIAFTPLRPWFFFSIHLKSVVHVVGTVEGVKLATRVKTDLKKPITGLACHPRSPILYVSYADGVVRAHGMQTYAVLYVLQPEDSSLKFLGTTSMAFHHNLNLLFVADRNGYLLAWDVSSPTKTQLVGLTQAGSEPLVSVKWHSTHQVVLTMSSEGAIKGWNPCISRNSGLSLQPNSFFHPAELESLDLGKILSQSGGHPVHPLPKPKDLLLHPFLNVGTILFEYEDVESEGIARRMNTGRENRKRLLAILQAAHELPGISQREKLSELGSAGIISDQDLQQHLMINRGLSKITQSTLTDYVRRAYLFGSGKNIQLIPKSLESLPLISLSHPVEPLHDVPVCNPFQTEFRYFVDDNDIFRFPARTILMDGCTLASYSVVTGKVSVVKKLSGIDRNGVERKPRHLVHSPKQQAFLIFFDSKTLSGEVVVYRYLDVNSPVGEGKDDMKNIKGRDGSFMGVHDSQFAILDDDGYGLTIYSLEDPILPESAPPKEEQEGRTELDENDFVEKNVFGYASRFDMYEEEETSEERGKKRTAGPVSLMFETPVQRIFGTPMEGSILYSSSGSHLGLVRVFMDEYGRLSGDLTEARDATVLSTKKEEGRFIPLIPGEIVLHVKWQTKPDGPVAGILTTHRVMIISSHMEVLSSSNTVFDAAYPPYRTCAWVGPSFFFTTATTLAMLGFDSIMRPLLTLHSASTSLLGVLNDRVLLLSRSDKEQSNGFHVKVVSRPLGLLEPLVIGFISLLQTQGPNPAVEPSKVLPTLVSRFDHVRITPRIVETLNRNSHVCCELASELSNSGPQFTSEIRASCAVEALRFDTALKILKDEFLRSRDYPRCPFNSLLFQRFRQLGRACIRYGQFDLAKEAFEIAGDYESMFNLFLSHMNPSALRHLSIKLEESGLHPELKRQCDRILHVRSAGWGTDGPLSGLASDNLAPKGPEYAGGNWPLVDVQDQVVRDRTKSQITWSLDASEPMHKMKSAEGAIPVHSPDSLGVYFGIEKGKITVLDMPDDLDKDSGLETKSKRVSEVDILNAAAKVFVDEGTGKVKAEIESVVEKDDEGEEEGMGAKTRGTEKERENGVKVDTGDHDDVDELQKKAEEEFKHGFNETGFDSDSDEEKKSSFSSTKSQRFRIQIKQKDSSSEDVKSSIDVHKIKAFTSSFKLGEVTVKPLKPLSSSLSSAAVTSTSSSLTSSTPPVNNLPISSNTEPAAASNTNDPFLHSPPVSLKSDSANFLASSTLSSSFSTIPAASSSLSMSSSQPPSTQRAPPPELSPEDFPPILLPGSSPDASITPLPGPQLSSSGSFSFSHSPAFQLSPSLANPGVDALFPHSLSVPSAPASNSAYPTSKTISTIPSTLETSSSPDFSSSPLHSSLSSSQPSIISSQVDVLGQLFPSSSSPSTLSTLSHSNTSPSLLSSSSEAVVKQLVDSIGPPSWKEPGSFLGSIGNFTPPGSSNAKAFESPPSSTDNQSGKVVVDKVVPGQVPRGQPASTCFKTGLVHIENNRLDDAMSCFDEAFLSLAIERSLDKDVSAQARICSQYKIAVLLLKEIARLVKAEGQGAVGAKEEMARLTRHLASLPLQAKHRISCMRMAIKRNMDVQNFAFSKRLLDLLLSKAPANKQAELRALVNVCVQRGLADRMIDGPEDASKFCASTLGRLPTIGHDTCDTCGANFSAHASPGCSICGMGVVRRSDAPTGGPFASPF